MRVCKTNGYRISPPGILLAAIIVWCIGFAEVHAQSTSDLACTQPQPGERYQDLITRGIISADGATLTQIEDQELTDSDLQAVPLEELRKLRTVAIRYSLSDDGIAYLCNAIFVENLHLEASGVTAESLKQIGKLDRLKQLMIALQDRHADEYPLSSSVLSQYRGLYRLEELYLSAPLLSDAGVSELAALTNLRSLTVKGSRLGDSALKAAAKLPQLEKLDYAGDGFTGAGLSYLADHPTLKELTLWGENFDGSGLSNLRSTSKLVSLSFPGSAAVSDVALNDLASLRQLKKLSFGGVGPRQCTDKTLKALGQLHKLESLTLSNCSVTDEGLKYLAPCAELRELFLGGKDNQLSDEGIKCLATLPKLRRVLIEGDSNTITDAGVEYLIDHSQLEWIAISSDFISNVGVSGLLKAGQLNHLSVQSSQLSDSQKQALNRFNNKSEP